GRSNRRQHPGEGALRGALEGPRRAARPAQFGATRDLSPRGHGKRQEDVPVDRRRRGARAHLEPRRSRAQVRASREREGQGMNTDQLPQRILALLEIDGGTVRLEDHRLPALTDLAEEVIASPQIADLVIDWLAIAGWLMLSYGCEDVRDRLVDAV